MPGREAEALADYAAVLKAHPNLVPVHYNLAIALARMPGQADAAIAEYQETLRLNPDLAAAHRNLGLVYARQGRLDLAEREWRTAFALNPAYTDLPAMLEQLPQQRGR
jgi:protein O-GlcNAc transferase